MEKPRKEEGFKIGELSGEVLNEWYAEREVLDVDRSEKKIEREEVQKVPLSKTPVVDSERDLSEEEDKNNQIKEKIKELLDIGEKKGLVYAIEKAKQSNDPFLLDVFHDILAKDGNYKNILKK